MLDENFDLPSDNTKSISPILGGGIPFLNNEAQQRLNLWSDFFPLSIKFFLKCKKQLTCQKEKCLQFLNTYKGSMPIKK